jgi:hypothetical protein
MKPLPSSIKAEVEKGGKFEATATRSYREVNQMNRDKDGMTRLHKSDPGFGSKITDGASHVEDAFEGSNTDVSY